jgi:Mg2+/Co2+ transporter CorB
MDAADPGLGMLADIALVAIAIAGWAIAIGLWLKLRRRVLRKRRREASADATASVAPEMDGNDPDPAASSAPDPLQNLAGLTVADIMVPRHEIVGLDLDADLGELLELAATSRHTRLPVYRDNVNNVQGVLNLRRLVRHLESPGQLAKADLLELAEEPYFIPRSTPLDVQLLNFHKEKKRIALVVDEYGEIHGLATLDDLLEEIVGGYLPNPHSLQPGIHPERDGAYLIDGLALVRDINRALDWDLPALGPRTLNGLVLERLETLPDNNLCVEIEGYRIETVQITDNLIRTLRVTRSPPPPAVERGHDRVE